jgi:hypothetical protein
MLLRAWNEPGPLSVVTGSFHVEQTSGNSTRAAQNASDHGARSVVSSTGTTTIISDIISEATECATSADVLSVATYAMLSYGFLDISSNIDEGPYVLSGHGSDFLGRHSLY